MSDGNTESEPMRVGGVHVKPGPGAIGMNMLIVLGVAAMVAVACWTISSDWIRAVLVAGAIALAVWVIQRNFDFAEKYPHAALLNSADLRLFLTREVASKGEIAPTNATIIENPRYKEIASPEPEQ